MSGRLLRRLVAAGVGTLTLLAGLPAASAASAEPGPVLGYDPTTDFGSMSMITRITGAQSAWAAGVTGAGVDVAVIDTGVTRVPGLDRSGKVIDGPDLSLDSQNPSLARLDGYGHGTAMASIIAGSDVAPGTSTQGCATCLNASPYSDTTKFVGVAPEARIVNVKVGAYDGGVDVTQVIAAINWTVQHRRDNGLNIRVLNLSFGTQSLAPADKDVLAYAAEQAWKAGIVVVAAAGNDGNTTTTALADPAYDPMILAVGTQDPMGTLPAIDDTVPAFAQHGTAKRPVDVVAPGVHVLGLRVPGSFVDTYVGTGIVGERFQRGSGTSQSTAVVSGLAALIVAKFPNATPDQVKQYLKATAVPLYRDTVVSVVKKAALETYGSGGAQVGGLSMTLLLPVTKKASSSSTGTGTLDQARGGAAMLMFGPSALLGERDIMGRPWDSKAMAALAAAGTSWNGGVWNGSVWTGTRWSAGAWEGAAWSGTDWTGAAWSGAQWSDMAWDGARWSGVRWSGVRWSSTDWTGARWSGVRWSTAELA